MVAELIKTNQKELQDLRTKQDQIRNLGIEDFFNQIDGMPYFSMKDKASRDGTKSTVGALQGAIERELALRGLKQDETDYLNRQIHIIMDKNMELMLGSL